MLIEINDNFGSIFLNYLILQNIFDCIFLRSVSDIDFKCDRVESIAIAGVPSNLGETSNREFFANCHGY